MPAHERPDSPTTSHLRIHRPAGSCPGHASDADGDRRRVRAQLSGRGLLIGRAPGTGGVQRSGAPRVAIDSRWASTEAVGFEAATDELSGLGILTGDLLVADGRSEVITGDLIIGRQGRRVAVLQVGRDGRSATPIAGTIDPTTDVRAYGRVVAVIRAPHPVLQNTRRHQRQRRG